MSREVMSGADVRRKFVEATEARRRRMIRLGFEAETQSTDGKTSDDGSPGASRSELKTFFEKYWKYFFRTEAISPGALVAEHFDSSWLVSPEALWESFSFASVKCLIDAAVDDDLDVGGLPGWLRRRYQFLTSIIPGLECGDDGSVSGFEFRTVGPNTYDACVRLAEKFFEGHDHDIDTRCSWHVHASLPGVKHQYGPDFQGALIAAVLRRIDRVPDSVLDRWVDPAAWRYFPITPGRTRAFVAYNSIGTWEFRCWGNIQNAQDGIRCFDLTVEAMHEAYAARTPAPCPTQESFAQMVTTERRRRAAGRKRA